MPLSAPFSAPSLTLEAGRVIGGKYMLERPAGFGGMAELWVATNQATAAEVCVKVLLLRRDGAAADDEAVARFRREAYAAARLSHRAIVRVFDLLELDETGALLKPARANKPHAYAIVMELLRGETLGDHLAKHGKLSLDAALDLFLPLLSALAHAHRANVIHRDIKPDNIFLAADPDGHIGPKVLDFGVSRLSDADGITNDGVVLGTPSFMSPEQAKGARTVDFRSDVFSAAVLFYVMLSGINPFDKDSFAASIEALVTSDPPPLDDLPAPLWPVLKRALEKDPAARYADATEMSAALRGAAGRNSSTHDTSPVAMRASAPSFPAAYDLEQGGSTERVSATLPLDAAEARPARSGGQRSGPVSLLPAGVPAPNPRVRLLVAAVLGVAVVIVLAAVIVSLTSTPSTPPPSTAARATATSPATAPPTPTVPSSATATATPIESATPTTTAAPSAEEAPKPKPAPTPKSSAQAPPRKPGHPPNMARDPGF